MLKENSDTKFKGGRQSLGVEGGVEMDSKEVSFLFFQMRET